MIVPGDLNKSLSEVLTDPNIIYQGFLDSCRSSHWKDSTQRFEMRYLLEIGKLADDIKNRTYRTEEFSSFILNERGHTRYIHGNQMRDKVLRHVLCDRVLIPILKDKLIYDNGAPTKR